uniref:Uncharacterized protein n=1 Tax=Magallana gigas TaxID=29159 RepID=K1QXM2_MAGGI
MPRSKSCGPKSYDCFNCQRRTRQKDRYPIHKKYRSLLYKPTGRTPCETDSLCNRCRPMFDSILRRKDDKKKSSTTLQQPEEKVLHPSQQAPFSPPSVTLPFPCTTRGHSLCCLCKKPGPKLVVVPVDVRHRIFISHEIVIPAGARCCPNHLQRNIEKISPSAEITTVNRSYISQLIIFLRTEVLKTKNTRLSFDNSSHLIDSDYVDLLGIPKAAYDDLLKYVDGRVKSTPSRTVRTSLAIFLMKLRGGDSNRILSTLFNFSKSGIRRSIKVIRSALIDGNFVKENLGFQHITREETIHQHTRPLAQTLFGDNTQPQVILLDGTYIYINKSSNFKFQRQSFSFHKGRQLVKPMVIVSTSGYFLSVLGPYFAKDNDASILTHMMRSNLEDIRNWVEEDDVFIVDRGFRDSLTYLEELGIQVKMPSFIEKGEKQLSTDAANTKNLKPLASGSVEEDQALGAKMLFLSKQVNQLKEQVEEQYLNHRTVCWREVNEVVDFPQLDEERLRLLTCGVTSSVYPPAMLKST